MSFSASPYPYSSTTYQMLRLAFVLVALAVCLIFWYRGTRANGGHSKSIILPSYHCPWYWFGLCLAASVISIITLWYFCVVKLPNSSKLKWIDLSFIAFIGFTLLCIISYFEFGWRYLALLAAACSIVAWYINSYVIWFEIRAQPRNISSTLIPRMLFHSIPYLGVLYLAFLIWDSVYIT